MASTGSTSTWRDIEAKTNRVLSIETNPTPENISKCNQQLQSPLFGVLPPEIRNDIFSLALLQYEDLTKPYPEHDFCYRPGHRARRIISTELLLTCRRIWLEANHWPMEQAVHSFWFEAGRRPEWTHTKNNDNLRLRNFLNGLTSTQKLRVKHLHISAQMYALERRCLDRYWLFLFVPDDLRLDTFTVTVRHSDWWLWESDEPLCLESAWLRTFLLEWDGATRMSEFRLELETLEWRIGQLRPILDSLRSVGSSGDDNSMYWELVEPFEEVTWSGPTNIGGEERDIYENRDKLDYRITTMKWRRRDPVTERIETTWRQESSLLKLLGEDTATASAEDADCETDNSDRSSDHEDDDYE